MIKITECPRDAMQGIKSFIPTADKVRLINQLLRLGYSRLDFGSFVSPKAIPQLADTDQVLAQLDLSDTKTELLAIVGNYRGAQRASKYPQIKYYGYPFSVSEEFLKRNINSNFNESVTCIEKIQQLAQKNNQQVVVYLSMALGNPYGEAWSVEIVEKWVKRMQVVGIKHIAISDTIGAGRYESIKELFSRILPAFPDMEIGFHLHTTSHGWKDKVQAAYESGCNSFDTVLNGLGGCPMTGYEMTSNLKTSNLLNFLEEHNEPHGIDRLKLRDALFTAMSVFSEHVSVK